ncbi:hypothetical protein CRE_12102 [Caenorhabditis remanei]|uniref:F-box domain-containing protein n=1 Tax=Caenorhabditis remanei TaxID=31234 RepID=E3MPX0_CAERE|nr:hypothetical protein CRE_12102 [Caenorhabditis remanei]
MSIPLLKFPYLIQIGIFKQLEFDEIFLMSLCSKKTKIMIQSARINVERLLYVLFDHAIQVSVGYNGRFQRPHDAIMLERVEVIARDSRIRIKLGGTNIDCSYRKRFAMTENVYLGYPSSEEDMFLKSFQRHMSSLFQNRPENTLITVFTNALYNSTGIKNINNAEIFIKEPDVLNTSQLKDFMNFHPTLDTIQLIFPLTGPPLTRESKIMKIKGLSVYNPGQRTSELMANFNGQYLHLANATYDFNDWKQLLKKWKRKESYGNLKAVITSPLQRNFVLDFDDLAAEFDLQEWDGERRPKNYRLDTTISHIRSKEYNCSKWLDMQQDGGGKWASITLGPSEINFVVWD